MTHSSSPPSYSPSSKALFRFLIVGAVESLVRAGWSSGKAAGAVAEQSHCLLDGEQTAIYVSKRSIQRWRAAFLANGMEALEPVKRKRTDRSEVLPEALLDFVVEQKTSDSRASVPEIIRRARVEGVLRCDETVDRTTLWRACKRMALVTRARPTKHEADTRRFSYTHRMQCVIADGKHFRAGAGRLKRVALFFLDDATRYGLGVVVGTAESSELFLRGLHNVVLKYGLMKTLYLDHGPGFVSLDTTRVVSVGLNALLVHGQKGYPQGRGKVERFNRTAQAGVLRSLPDAPSVDPHCAALEIRLQHFLDSDYNQRPHESLSQRSPWQCWEADDLALRFPADEADLTARFIVTDVRSVSADHVIKHGGKLWEAPRGLARSSVKVRRNVLSGELSVIHRGEAVRLHEVDVHANAITRRGYSADSQPLPDEGVPTTAATMAFQRDMAPVVGRDGGFIKPEDD